MPVYLEKITAPQGQDKTDLETLYAEYLEASSSAVTGVEAVTGSEKAGDMSPAVEKKEGAAAAGEWLQAQLADNKQICYGGRFNGRLLGAVFARPQGDGCLLLEHLCVRALTRRRGFARQLVQRLQQQCREQGGSLLVTDNRAPAILWQQLEFEQHEQGWSWAP